MSSMYALIGLILEVHIIIHGVYFGYLFCQWQKVDIKTVYFNERVAILTFLILLLLFGGGAW